jgi:hypothetical protein
MSTPETKITDILRNVSCKKICPKKANSVGGLLLAEIVKLAAMTAGYIWQKPQEPRMSLPTWKPITSSKAGGLIGNRQRRF